MKKIAINISHYIFLSLIVCLYSCTSTDENLQKAENVVSQFYKFENQMNYSGIDSLISFKFYQKTPYSKLVSILKEKNKIVGHFKNKNLEDYRVNFSTNQPNTIYLEYKVEYSKTTTREFFY